MLSKVRLRARKSRKSFGFSETRLRVAAEINAHEPVGLGVRKRPQQYASMTLNMALFRADAQRQRQYDDDGKAGRPPQRANRVAQVVPDSFELIDAAHIAHSS